MNISVPEDIIRVHKMFNANSFYDILLKYKQKYAHVRKCVGILFLISVPCIANQDCGEL